MQGHSGRTAVIFAPGCEEGEALTIVDIFRRAGLECDAVGLGGREVAGANGVTVRCDAAFDGSLADYGMVVLPGGYGGVDAMRADEALLGQLGEVLASGRRLAAICAAPLALDEAGLLEGRTFTCYPTVVPQVSHGTFVEDVVVEDGNLVTSRGPATAWEFAYRLVELMGGDAEVVRQRMVWSHAFDTSARGTDNPEGIVVPRPEAAPKVAMLMVDGFEESETAQVMDLLHRAGAHVRAYRFQEDPWVVGMQGLVLRSDEVFSPEAVAGADAIVVPGGRTAGGKLIAREDVLQALRDFDAAGKLVCAMCSGTTVAHAAGVLEGRRVTGYTGYGERLTGAYFVADEVAVTDGNVVTSQGPATPDPFAFAIIEALGLPTAELRCRLLYHVAGGR